MTSIKFCGILRIKFRIGLNISILKNRKLNKLIANMKIVCVKEVLNKLKKSLKHLPPKTQMIRKILMNREMPGRCHLIINKSIIMEITI